MYYNWIKNTKTKMHLFVVCFYIAWPDKIRNAKSIKIWKLGQKYHSSVFVGYSKSFHSLEYSRKRDWHSLGKNLAFWHFGQKWGKSLGGKVQSIYKRLPLPLLWNSYPILIHCFGKCISKITRFPKKGFK